MLARRAFDESVLIAVGTSELIFTVHGNVYPAAPITGCAHHKPFVSTCVAKFVCFPSVKVPCFLQDGLELSNLVHLHDFGVPSEIGLPDKHLRHRIFVVRVAAHESLELVPGVPVDADVSLVHDAPVSREEAAHCATQAV
eukprot:962022-Pyramimonas_sp.AAC.1